MPFTEPDICPRCGNEHTTGKILCRTCEFDAIGTVHPRWFDRTYLAAMTKEDNARHPMQDVIDAVDDISDGSGQ